MTDYDIHSCGYYCERPACLKAQRDELRDRLAAELPLVRVEEFVELIKGKENFRGIPVMRTEWPLEDRWVKTYSGGKPNYTQPEEKIAEFKFQNYGWWKDEDGKMQLGTFPPKKEWVGLTDEEILAAGLSAGFKAGSVRFNLIVQSIEAKLKEKNT